MTKDGTFISTAYGELGVAAVQFILGDTYFMNSSDFRSKVVPANFKALIYAARIAEQPYTLASAPIITNLALIDGERLGVSLVADDSLFGNAGSGGETINNIASVIYCIDVRPEVAPSGGIKLYASDGLFNSPTETVTFMIDAKEMTVGKHILYLQATDSSGAKSPLYTKYFYVNEVN
jgi:hypothetical protein